jgi:hypothetical protein
VVPRVRARERDWSLHDGLGLARLRTVGKFVIIFSSQLEVLVKKAKTFQSYLLACSRVASLRFCFTVKFGALAMPVLPAGGAAVLLDE